MTNWPDAKTKLSKAELIRYKVRYCKNCGKKLSFMSGQRLYCLKCRPLYPSDKT